MSSLIKKLTLFFALFVSSTCWADLVEVNIDFPHGEAPLFGIQMHKKGVVGSIPESSPYKAPSRLQIQLINRSMTTVHSLNLSFKLDLPLQFQTEQIPEKGEWGETNQFLWSIQKIEPHEEVSVVLNVLPPLETEFEEKSKTCRLRYSGEGEGENFFKLSGTAFLELKNPQQKWLSFFVLFNGPILLLLLLVFGRYKNLFKQYSTSNLVTLATLIAFYLGCTLVSQILRSFGMPSIVLHTAWAVYFWIFLIATVRLIPQKGALLLFIFGSTLLTELLLWGLNFVSWCTYSIPAAVALEIWFRSTGYGKTLFSCLGGAFMFFAYPICLFWFFVAPVLFHYYYHWWYILFWISINLVSYLIAAWIGYHFSNRLMRALR